MFIIATSARVGVDANHVKRIKILRRLDATRRKVCPRAAHFSVARRRRRTPRRSPRKVARAKMYTAVRSCALGSACPFRRKDAAAAATFVDVDSATERTATPSGAIERGGGAESER